MAPMGLKERIAVIGKKGSKLEVWQLRRDMGTLYEGKHNLPEVIALGDNLGFDEVIYSGDTIRLRN